MFEKYDAWKQRRDRRAAEASTRELHQFELQEHVLSENRAATARFAALVAPVHAPARPVAPMPGPAARALDLPADPGIRCPDRAAQPPKRADRTLPATIGITRPERPAPPRRASPVLPGLTPPQRPARQPDPAVAAAVQGVHDRDDPLSLDSDYRGEAVRATVQRAAPPLPQRPAAPRRPAAGPRAKARRAAAMAAKPLPQGAPPPPAAPDPDALWRQLRSVTLSAAHLEQHKIISARRTDPAHVAFDVLRTRLLAALRDNGWSRVAITSPTKDCGKSFTAANLAISLSRHESHRTILMDMDLRNPSLHKVLGVADPGSMSAFLAGERGVGTHLLRVAENAMNIGQNLALGLNGRVETYAAELLQEPASADMLDAMHDMLRPDVTLFDLPPALYHDDVLAFRAQYDGVLLVIGGGITKAQDVREVKRRLGTDTPLLGVVMNRSEGISIADYSY